MYVLTGKNCPNCKMLKDYLNQRGMVIPEKLAEENMDLCREYMIKTIPALVVPVEEIVEGFKTNSDNILVLCGLGEITPFLDKLSEKLFKYYTDSNN